MDALTGDREDVGCSVADADRRSIIEVGIFEVAAIRLEGPGRSKVASE
jgi:hypothetical protein